MSNLATYIEDLEQDPFDPTDYVERLAWRLSSAGECLEPSALRRAFEDQIYNLHLLCEQYERRVERLDAERAEEDEALAVELDRLAEANAHAASRLKQLDERLSAVAGRVVHVGGQLETLNAPRERATEALQLMAHFAEFADETPLSSAVFTDPDKLLESAEVMHRLAAVAQELTAQKYTPVRTRIQNKYDEIEQLVLEEFQVAHRNGDKSRMRRCAHILSHYKRYNDCMDKFVSNIQIGAFRSSDLFADIFALCQGKAALAAFVFPSGEQVMEKLVLNLFCEKLQAHVSDRLGDPFSDVSEPEDWLRSLNELYMKTLNLSERLSSLSGISSDKEFLPKLVGTLFGRYVERYCDVELNYLNAHCVAQLESFYKSKGHEKRVGGIHELKRDIQARMFSADSFTQSLLSEELAISILQEAKSGYARCTLLSPALTKPADAARIYDILARHLLREHVAYALEIALCGIPSSEPKAPPPTHFYACVRQAATICHLFDRQFDECLVPLVKGSSELDACINSKRHDMTNIENKLASGLDKQLSASMGYVRFLLASNEQRRIEYATSDDAIVNSMALLSEPHQGAGPMASVARYIADQADTVSRCLDGSNVTNVLTSLGTRLHRALLEHIYSMQYSTTGAFRLVSDVNECSDQGLGLPQVLAKFRVPLLTRLFGVLQSLCKLLTLKPDNLAEAAQSDVLTDVDRATIVNFIQLRADYRPAKLFYEFR